MDTLQAFKNVDQYPKDIVPGQIFVDMKRFAVLIPNTPTTFIPFHVSCIKSVSDMIQGQWTFLRINFHIAQTNTMHYPPMEDPNNLWIKELTMKTKSSAANNRLKQASEQIKECLKQAKT
jgi:nucleosome binding factor SPN SPT16 subunit